MKNIAEQALDQPAGLAVTAQLAAGHDPLEVVADHHLLDVAGGKQAVDDLVGEIGIELESGLGGGAVDQAQGVGGLLADFVAQRAQVRGQLQGPGDDAQQNGNQQRQAGLLGGEAAARHGAMPSVSSTSASILALTPLRRWSSRARCRSARKVSETDGWQAR